MLSDEKGSFGYVGGDDEGGGKLTGGFGYSYETAFAKGGISLPNSSLFWPVFSNSGTDLDGLTFLRLNKKVQIRKRPAKNIRLPENIPNTIYHLFGESVVNEDTLIDEQHRSW